MNDKGSITALYTVLVEGDDMNEPVADETRSILDGHIIDHHGRARGVRDRPNTLRNRQSSSPPPGRSPNTPLLERCGVRRWSRLERRRLQHPRPRLDDGGRLEPLRPGVPTPWNWTTPCFFEAVQLAGGCLDDHTGHITEAIDPGSGWAARQDQRPGGLDSRRPGGRTGRRICSVLAEQGVGADDGGGDRVACDDRAGGRQLACGARIRLPGRPRRGSATYQCSQIHVIHLLAWTSGSAASCSRACSACPRWSRTMASNVGS